MGRRLSQLCGTTGPVDVDKHCYEPVGRLLERQRAIQKTLTKKHLSDGCLVLYDITSNYFEGEYAESELVQFGYNRDGKHGHEQVVIGLLTSAEGCLVAVEISDPDCTRTALLLVRNPHNAARETKPRNELVEHARKALDQLRYHGRHQQQNRATHAQGLWLRDVDFLHLCIYALHESKDILTGT